jgi:hypothetical protein
VEEAAIINKVEEAVITLKAVVDIINSPIIRRAINNNFRTFYSA